MASAAHHQQHPITGYLKYEYKPIDLDTTAIRLIRIIQGPYDSPVRCHIFESYLDSDSGVPYEALSYVWGDEVPDEQLLPIDIVNEDSGSTSSLSIYPNLHEILRNLRQPGEDRVVWVDAVCIDQKEHHRERAHQVGQMMLVYKNAERVIIWLGDFDDDVELLLRLARKLDVRVLERYWNRSSGTSAWDTNAWELGFQEEMGNHDITPNGKTLHQRIYPAMDVLLERSWFTRTWIIQEVASAKSGLIVCGRAGRTVSIATRTFAVLPSLMGLTPPPHVQAILDVMPVKGQLRSGWWNERRDLQTLLTKFQGRHCTEPRDSVYALLGICLDTGVKEIIKADYDIPTELVFGKTLSYLVFSKVIDESICQRFAGDRTAFFQALNHSGGLLQWILEWVCINGSETVAQLLLDLRETSRASKDERHEPHISDPALEDECKAVVRVLPTGQGINTDFLRNFRDRIPPHTAITAIIAGQTSIAKMLLAYDRIQDISVENIEGKTLLRLAFEADIQTWTSIAKMLPAKYNPMKNAHPQNTEGAAILLYLAIKAGQVSTVEKLLEINGITGYTRMWDYLTFSPQGDTPLNTAVKAGQISIIETLLPYSTTRINIRNRQGDTPLHIAVKAGQTSAVETLLAYSTIKPNSLDKRGNTPLHNAIKAGQTSIVERLLGANGIDVNLPDADGIPPLLRAVMNMDLHTEDTDIARMIRQHNGIDAKLAQALSPPNLKPLSLAVIRRDNEGLHQILESNGLGEQCLHESETNEALHWALKTQEANGDDAGNSIQEIWTANFLPSGAGGHVPALDVNWKDCLGDTLLGLLLGAYRIWESLQVRMLGAPYMAPRHRSPLSRNELTSYISEILQDDQVDFNMITRCDGHHGTSEMTPLKIAAIDGNIDMVEHLLRVGSPKRSRTDVCDPRKVVDLEAGVGECCGTPLWAAVQWHHNDVARLLVEEGANRECKGWHLDAAVGSPGSPTMVGVTPLWQAVHLGNIDMVHWLIYHGANLRTTGKALHQTAMGLVLDEEERTLVEEARFHGFDNIVEVLLEGNVGRYTSLYLWKTAQD